MKTAIAKINSYMERVPEVRRLCERCLRTERYDGNVAAMVVDASFVSIGLNYFNVIVPAVLRFKETFGDISLSEFLEIPEDKLFSIWKNRRSWRTARNVAEALLSFGKSDREMLRNWASESSLDGWKEDVIGRIKGVGINTYQYLRMMGGIDTVMPDKIVRKVFTEIFGSVPKKDIEFIKWVEDISKKTEYRSIELCWMTWFVQYDDLKIKKYLQIMEKA
ncbi:hypothetical protein Asulf_00482 [Archaeoglobus sulfaticallidus PM70-1]|uniref:3-methyladenine DNA glycosylase/8-oxoguanine DNA glycosylase n=1 Tax=Archaeoglobus sulfaticallidus PM70-1 TaxID=387631 RepID=N0BAA3_9EURY|nr:hypothetical protein [Archaeoglobus sulfaticallidus]AGK60509.1 hypothetical protein Asulf_00482 [Archaeoglobus sulfaticallidus PM70-1]